MLISRKSPRTGLVSVMDLPITPDQLALWEARTGLIQDIMPELTPNQREFLITGYTPEDWEILFGPSGSETDPDEEA